VDADGQKAFRTDIRLGRQNPEYYEVLAGLEPGDKVVTSSYDNYEDMGELVINDSPE
jgi:HlyD family secretion protein